MCFTAMPPNRSRKLPDWVLEVRPPSALMLLYHSFMSHASNQLFVCCLAVTCPRQGFGLRLTFSFPLSPCRKAAWTRCLIF